MDSTGLYIATAGEDKQLAIWDSAKMSCILQKEMPDVPTDLAWHQHGNELAVVTQSGELGVWKDVIPPDLTGPAVPVEQMDVDKEMSEEALADGRLNSYPPVARVPCSSLVV